ADAAGAAQTCLHPFPELILIQHARQRIEGDLCLVPAAVPCKLTECAGELRLLQGDRRVVSRGDRAICDTPECVRCAEPDFLHGVGTHPAGGRQWITRRELRVTPRLRARRHEDDAISSDIPDGTVSNSVPGPKARARPGLHAVSVTAEANVRALLVVRLHHE